MCAALPARKLLLFAMYAIFMFEVKEERVE